MFNVWHVVKPLCSHRTVAHTCVWQLLTTIDSLLSSPLSAPASRNCSLLALALTTFAESAKTLHLSSPPDAISAVQQTVEPLLTFCDVAKKSSPDALSAALQALQIILPLPPVFLDASTADRWKVLSTLTSLLSLPSPLPLPCLATLLSLSPSPATIELALTHNLPSLLTAHLPNPLAADCLSLLASPQFPPSSFSAPLKRKTLAALSEALLIMSPPALASMCAALPTSREAVLVTLSSACSVSSELAAATFAHSDGFFIKACLESSEEIHPVVLLANIMARQPILSPPLIAACVAFATKIIGRANSSPALRSSACGLINRIFECCERHRNNENAGKVIAGIYNAVEEPKVLSGVTSMFRPDEDETKRDKWSFGEASSQLDSVVILLNNLCNTKMALISTDVWDKCTSQLSLRRLSSPKAVLAFIEVCHVVATRGRCAFSGSTTDILSELLDTHADNTALLLKLSMAMRGPLISTHVPAAALKAYTDLLHDNCVVGKLCAALREFGAQLEGQQMHPPVDLMSRLVLADPAFLKEFVASQGIEGLKAIRSLDCDVSPVRVVVNSLLIISQLARVGVENYEVSHTRKLRDERANGARRESEPAC